jgi:hypothetical protein
MKARGLILIDYDFPDGFKEAALEEARLEAAMQELVRGNNRVTYYQSTIKERRGDGKPDLNTLKLRTG